MIFPTATELGRGKNLVLIGSGGDSLVETLGAERRIKIFLNKVLSVNVRLVPFQTWHSHNWEF